MLRLCIGMGNQRVLIVEDESLIALDLTRILENNGWTVVAIVASGEEAVAVAADLNPNLILMDILLRGPMDGISAAEKIRMMGEFAIVFLTANSDIAFSERAQSIRPEGCVLKPFKDSELLQVIRDAV